MNYTNIKYLSLSNNYIFDYNIKGLYDTTNSLNSINIKYAGEGKNIFVLQKYKVLKINNLNFAGIYPCEHMEGYE